MTTSISKNYEFQQSDAKWYQHWLENQYFESRPDEREPYTITIPPPNVTGILHMGHCLNNTIQDILIRYARANGKNACWVPGTDHASIATEAKVVQMLRERGIKKSDLSRDEFLQYAWEWKEKYGGIILQQLKKLGCSLDWSRTAFTMDEDYSKSVIKVFVSLYEKGLIYRGKRMINWDPQAKTALSDEEVIFKAAQSNLYHLAYPLADKDGNILPGKTITIATVRPETILGDTAIAVHPNDERYSHLKGAFALVPLINRQIPIIFDDYVEKDFGTGALKVTPAHDMNDFQLGQKHQLEVIDIMNDDGTFSEDAQIFVGLDRFEVRKKIVPMLEEQGFLVKKEPYNNQIGYSERSNAVVEPRLSLQWWVKMEPLAKDSLRVVEDGEINFHPEKFKNLYRHWMVNIKDWCISRQLWWGHRIPAWYLPDGKFVVAENKETAWQTLSAEGITAGYTTADLIQDPDCLDTWFSSWLWPFEVFQGLSRPGNADAGYYYPTSTLVTAPEIIFFWVARMIMAGLEFQGKIPFKDVYFTGIVRDEKGRKMSKSLGNSPDLLALIDQYGADAVRFGIMISSPAGNDLLFDVKEESTLKQGSFFVNKIWNALKLIKLWEQKGSSKTEANEPKNWPGQWFAARLAEAKTDLQRMMEQFRLSEALKLLYSLIWDDYCSWYLEWIKPEQNENIGEATLSEAQSYLEELMQLLHPFMPFVSEEIYHQLQVRVAGDDLCIRQMTPGKMESGFSELLSQGKLLQQTITTLRDARNKAKLKPKDNIEIKLQTKQPQAYIAILALAEKQVNAKILTVKEDEKLTGTAVTIDADKFYLQLPETATTAEQVEQLEKDLAYQQQFFASTQRKLQNEKFVQNARPEVVALERKKLADAEARIQSILEALQNG